MPNTVMTVQQAGAIFSKDAAAVLHDSLKFLKTISIEDDAQYKKQFNDVSEGQTIKIRKPARFQTRTGLTFSGQDFVEENASLTRANVIGVDIAGFTGIELATDLHMEKVKNMSDRVIVPAAKQLAADLEKAVMAQLYSSLWNTAGVAGTTPNSRRAIADCRRKLQKFLAPESDRYILMNSDAELEIGESLKGYLNPTDYVSKLIKEGYLGRTAGFELMTNELIPYHTNGNSVTNVLVNGASQTGATLNIDGLTNTTGTVKKGQSFTITGVYAVHPETKQAYDFLQEFVFTADGTANGSGQLAASISPAIVTSGPRQTVSAAPADNAQLTFKGAASTAYPQNMFYQKEAFRFMTLPMPLMKDSEVAENATYDGIDIQFHHFWDKQAYKKQTRLDVLWGATTVREEHAGRLFG